MGEIYPFRALHYNPARVVDLSQVVTQPYDKISGEMQARYYAAHPANLVRVILRRQGEENPYREAAREFHNWIEDHTLISEQEPCLYPYLQEFQVPGGARRQRWGWIALLRLADYSSGVVHRHEQTLSGPKADRLELLKATRANFGHIFMLYSDPRGEVEGLLRAASPPKPWQQVTDEYGTLHQVGRVMDPAVIESVVEAMRDKKLVIADGHHRYETSLTYRNLRRVEAPGDDRAEYVMATLVPMESAGLLILPTHRVVHGLTNFEWEDFARKAKQWFEEQDLSSASTGKPTASELRAALEKAGGERPSWIAYAGRQRVALLTLRRDVDLARWMPEVAEGLRHLDVVLLHRLCIERALGIDPEAVREQKNLRYVRELEAALKEVDESRAQVAFLMNPTPMAAVWNNALAGQVLPQKSTDFYPKLLSGLTLYWMDNPRGL